MKEEYVIAENGVKIYFMNDLYHREDGPAIDYPDGTKLWFYLGERHRLDGPAIEFINGNKAWFYYGKRIDCENQEEFERLIKLKAFW